VEVFRETEVENLDTPAGKIIEHRHNILRFEVAMDDSVAVRCDQCVGELRTTVKDLIGREPGPRQRFAPCTAFNVFINNKAPLTLLNKVIYSGDAWVIQSGGCGGFGRKATAQFGVATSIGR
jgi:hypothetical protein